MENSKRGNAFLVSIILAMCIILGIVCCLYLFLSRKTDDLRQQAISQEDNVNVERDVDSEAILENAVMLDDISISVEKVQTEDTSENVLGEDEENEDYLCSYSSERLMTESDVVSLRQKSTAGLPSGSTMIQMVINELYAKHGYEFKNTEIKHFFEQKAWYRDIAERTSDMNIVQQRMSDIEKSNVDYLRDADR